MQNLNEVSARYTELPEEFYIPKTWRKQDTKNKQGSIEELGIFNPVVDVFFDRKYTATEYLVKYCSLAYQSYQDMIEAGIAREMARMVLPVNIYTECYSCWDLKNLLHFVALREDSHAQAEIQEYAKAIKEILMNLFPWTMSVFDRYKHKITEL